MIIPLIIAVHSKNIDFKPNINQKPVKMTTIELREKYGPEATIVAMYRHGTKTPTGHITPECLAEVMTNGIPGIGKDVTLVMLGSCYARTHEMSYALLCWLSRQLPEVHDGDDDDDDFVALEPIGHDKRVGNPIIFNGLKDAMGKKDPQTSNYQAAIETEAGKAWSEGMAELMADIFEAFGGATMAICGHTPGTEIAYNLYAEEKDPSWTAKELECIFLVQAEYGGKIIALK